MKAISPVLFGFCVKAEDMMFGMFAQFISFRPILQPKTKGDPRAALTNIMYASKKAMLYL